MNIKGVRKGVDTVVVPDATVANAAGTPALAAAVGLMSDEIAALTVALAALGQRVTALENEPDPTPDPPDPPDPEPPEPEPPLPEPEPPVGDLAVRARWPDLGDLTSGGVFPVVDQPSAGAGVASAISLVAGSTRGFTRGNLLRIRTNVADYGNVELGTQIPLATSHYGRAYVDVELRFTTNHGFSYPHKGDIQYVPFAFRVDGDLFSFFSGTKYDANRQEFPDPFRWGFFHHGLTPGKYRVEWHYEVVNVPGSAPIKARFHPRLYLGWADDAPLVAHEGTMKDTFWDANQRKTLAQFWALGNVLGGSIADLARRHSCGQEGNNGFPANGGNCYVGDYGIAFATWVGVR
jgi:hypothetical protein